MIDDTMCKHPKQVPAERNARIDTGTDLGRLIPTVQLAAHSLASQLQATPKCPSKKDPVPPAAKPTPVLSPQEDLPPIEESLESLEPLPITFPLHATPIPSIPILFASALTREDPDTTTPQSPDASPPPICSKSDDTHTPLKTHTKHSHNPKNPARKKHARHYEEHHYHDHLMDPPLLPNETIKGKPPRAAVVREAKLKHATTNRHATRGGVNLQFPEHLHIMLAEVERDKLDHIVSWQPHGRAFAVHDANAFIKEIMPQYFRQSKLSSFQRQLNLYGFSRLTTGRDKGGYYHECFLRGRRDLCATIGRTRVKGTRVRTARDPETEPDFYSMEPCEGGGGGTPSSEVKSNPTTTTTTPAKRAAAPVPATAATQHPAKKQAVSSSRKKIKDEPHEHPVLHPTPLPPHYDRTTVSELHGPLSLSTKSSSRPLFYVNGPLVQQQPRTASPRHKSTTMNADFKLQRKRTEDALLLPFLDDDELAVFLSEIDLASV